MSARKYFSYIRVSTVRQGQTGTSLDEQKSAIERYAVRYGLQIIEEFKEKETAAKMGRPIFSRMLKALRQGRACGVVMHKIDRSARNLKDWADLGELIDGGIEIHFANESLDLHSRGGRLSADIQAVVAADYIRNLREETRKGFYGRLKQGLYPRPAPAGYLDCGRGQPKEPDPVQAPLVRQAFELYATGLWSLDELVERMYAAGLRGRSGRKVTRNGLSHMLHNIFYTGVIQIKVRGEIYSGQHRPIVSMDLFERVRRVLAGKNNPKQVRHFMLFRRLLTCVRCRTTLIGEVKKGHTYYRCHTRGCPQKTVREEVIETSVTELLKGFRFTPEENRYLRDHIKLLYRDYADFREAESRAGHLQLEQVQTRLAKLADAYIDEVLDKETYLAKKNGLVLEEKEIRERLERLNEGETKALRRVEEFLELVNNAYESWKKATQEERAELVRIVTSNLLVEEKKVIFKLNNPFEIIENRERLPAGSPQRDVPRTISALLSQLTEYFRRNEVKTLSQQSLTESAA